MKDIFQYLLERKVLSISTSTLRIMFHSVLLGGAKMRGVGSESTSGFRPAEVLSVNEFRPGGP